MEDYESYLHERIAQHQREYEAAVRPLIAELARIQSVRQGPPLVMTREAAEALGFTPIQPPRKPHEKANQGGS